MTQPIHTSPGPFQTPHTQTQPTVCGDETGTASPRAAISCGTLDDMKLEQTSFINGNKKPFVPENPLLFILTSVP
jgi:hypothetical protein